VLEELAAMVHRGVLDWFDAAVMTHQLGKTLAAELRGYMKAKVG
jgi:hypothetical protein